MSRVFKLNLENPQKRLLLEAAEIIKQGGVIVYPTDSAYALGACLGDKRPISRIKEIRNLDKKHNFTLMCSDLKEIATYARVDNPAYRLLKSHLPGPYTFILKATTSVPKLLLHPKKRTIGLRVSDYKIVRHLLQLLEAPLLTSTLILPGKTLPLNDVEEIKNKLEKSVDLILDGGCCGLQSTTVVSLLNNIPEIIRAGKGDISAF
ncbi:MAG: L-threonylcarbamoyladenylate synthase [Endozoicomonadaceae bacterium]|nr:L-threonylcarbamoyladenylate synthase [Endozoicomonadaceae bacterium]MCY4330546.1 L-threonylcarbamoyladenylate synthase [Endozoicomonadaceae bacterium]